MKEDTAENGAGVDGMDDGGCVKFLRGESAGSGYLRRYSSPCNGRFTNVQAVQVCWM